jgi:hypothetical protein
VSVGRADALTHRAPILGALTRTFDALLVVLRPELKTAAADVRVPVTFSMPAPRTRSVSALRRAACLRSAAHAPSPLSLSRAVLAPTASSALQGQRRHASTGGGGGGPGGPGGGFPGGFSFKMGPQHNKGEALKEYVRTFLLSVSGS